MISVFGYCPDQLGLQRGKYSGGNKLHVKCPFHESKSGTSATFYIDTGVLHCYKCSRRFYINDIVNKTGGIAIKKVIEIKNKDDLDNWEDLLRNKVDPTNEYLLSRKVSPQQITKYQIRVTEKGIAIPICNSNGEEVGLIVRQTNDYIRYLYGGKRLPLWPMNELKSYDPNERLFVVEGIFGALRGQLYGHNVIATLGAMVKKDIAPYIRHFKNIVGVFDPDDAGYIGGARLLKYVPHARILAPGLAVDEVEKDTWELMTQATNFTQDLQMLERLVNKKETFKRFGGR